MEPDTFGDLDNPESKISKLAASGKAKPPLLAGINNTRVYYIPSPNEPDWDRLATNGGFLEALARRKKGLSPIRGIL